MNQIPDFTKVELNLEMCVRTIYGDLNSDCHAFGILRFEVTDEDTGFLNAKLFLSLSALIALLAFVGNAFNQGLLIPIPILSALAVMMLLFVPTAFSQNNLGADSAIYENTRIPNAELFDENGESYTITVCFSSTMFCLSPLFFLLLSSVSFSTSSRSGFGSLVNLNFDFGSNFLIVF